MENKTTFGRFEATALTINLICSKLFLNFPRTLVEVSGTAAWIQIIYVTTIALILLSIIIKLYKGFEGMDLLDLGEFLGGNIGRVIVGLIIVPYLTFTVATILREYAENMKTVSLEVSPLSFVITFLLGAAIIATYKGIEAIARVHAIVVPSISIIFLLIMLSIIPHCKFDNLFPIMGNGFKSIFVKGFFGISIYSPIIGLFLIPTFIKTNRNFISAGYLSFFISAMYIMIITVVFIMIFPYPISKESFLPCYSLTRLINYGRFFERLESIFIIIWTLSALMYLSIVFFFVTYLFKKAFKLSYRKPLVFPFAIIIFIISFLPNNVIEAIKFETEYYAKVSWIIAFIMPIMLLICANIKKNLMKKGGKKNGEKSI